MIHQTHQFRVALKLAAIGVSVVALQGCSGAMSNIFGPRAPAIEQIRVPQAGQTRPPVAAGRTPSKIIRSADTTQRQDIALNVTYLERILVPVGSELVLQAQSDADRPPAMKAIKTQSGPPYSVTLPVDTGAGAYPMRVRATLTSTIGHVLSGTTTLRSRPTGPVEIIMRTSAAAPPDGADSAE